MSMVLAPEWAESWSLGSADFLKIIERTIYRLAVTMKFPVFKVRRSWRFSRYDLDAWIKEQSSGPSAFTEVR